MKRFNLKRFLEAVTDARTSSDAYQEALELARLMTSNDYYRAREKCYPAKRWLVEQLYACALKEHCEAE